MRTGVRARSAPRLRDEIRREHERLLLVHKQIKRSKRRTPPRIVRAKGSVERRWFSLPSSRRSAAVRQF